MHKEDILDTNSLHLNKLNASSSLLSSSRYLEEKNIPASDFVFKSLIDELPRST